MMVGIVILTVVAVMILVALFMIGANMTKDAINKSIGFDEDASCF